MTPFARAKASSERGMAATSAIFEDIIQMNDGDAEVLANGPIVERRLVVDMRQEQPAASERAEWEDRLAALEARVGALEDELAIRRLIARYGPSVDSRSVAAATSLWTEDGWYDYGARVLQGAKDVGELVNRPPHVDYVARGCAHVLSAPTVAIQGNRAMATCYSTLHLHGEGAWTAIRVSANQWDFVRTSEGWRVSGRLNRPLDGSAEPREILARGARDAP